MSYKININDFEGVHFGFTIVFHSRDKLNIYDIPISKLQTIFYII